MKRLARIAAMAGIVLVALIGGLLGFTAWYSPAQRDTIDLKIEPSPERLERGQYLTTTLGCFTCHSQRDWSKHAGPPTGTLGAGGECFPDTPGTVCAPNITPHQEAGVGAWTDDELLRAIREGVDREGNALFPIMPYPSYRHLSDEDAQAIVAYLRTLPASDHRPPETDIDFPVSFFIKLVPEPIDAPVTAPPRAPSVEYGKYLTTVALCKTCHTPTDSKHRPLEGKDFSGGQVFKAEFGTATSTNITPHETGLRDRTLESFIGQFRAYQGEPSAAGTKNTVMPWHGYARMSNGDLEAIFMFLKSLEPKPPGVSET